MNRISNESNPDAIASMRLAVTFFFGCFEEAKQRGLAANTGQCSIVKTATGNAVFVELIKKNYRPTEAEWRALLLQFCPVKDHELIRAVLERIADTISLESKN